MAAEVLHGAYAHAAAAPTSDDGRPTLLVTTVDIGEGRQGRIELRLGDDPVDVARAFCNRHGLPETIVLPLAQHLEDNLAENAAAAAAEADSDGMGGDAADGRYSGAESQVSVAVKRC